MASKNGTLSESRRAAAADVLAGRLPERITDIRRQLVAYKALIVSPGATRTVGLLDNLESLIDGSEALHAEVR
jgi:hypothetical protein